MKFGDWAAAVYGQLDLAIAFQGCAVVTDTVDVLRCDEGLDFSDSHMKTQDPLRGNCGERNLMLCNCTTPHHGPHRALQIHQSPSTAQHSMKWGVRVGWGMGWVIERI